MCLFFHNQWALPFFGIIELIYDIIIIFVEHSRNGRDASFICFL